jgi:biopolymer transport protein ExbD
MAEKVKTGFKEQWIPVASAIVLCLTLITACAQQPGQTVSTPAPRVQNTPPPQPAKIELNGEEMGTTVDTSRLNKFLKNVLKQREEQDVTIPGTSQIEKTVLIRAERSLRISEVFKVIEAVKQARAYPIQMAIEVEENFEEARSTHRSRLMLVVTIGNHSTPEGKMISFGITLTPRFGVEPVEKASIIKPEHPVVPVPLAVTILKDGQYVIGEKPIEKSALRSELKARQQERDTKSINLLIESDAGISYGSLEEVANAASAAGVEELVLITVAS